MPDQPKQLPAFVLRGLRRVGIFQPDLEINLHFELAQTIQDLGEAVSDGVLFTRLQYVAGMEKADAIRELKEAELEFEHAEAKAVALLQNERDYSHNRALSAAKADPEIKRLGAAVIFAEYRKQVAAAFSDSLRREVEVWRTVQANDRVADQMAAAGISGRP